jgi:peptidyl-prolyl cis-trans isomerase D
MSLINKIRERSGLTVGIVLAALVSFVLTDYFTGGNVLTGKGDQEVGEIAGQSIDNQTFQAKIEQIAAQYEQQTGRRPGEQEMAQVREQAWNQLIFETAYQKEYDKLGLTVSPDELVDMVQGENISPEVRQAFTDPQTGVFDKTKIIQYLKGLNNVPPAQKAQWASFEQQLSVNRIREKYDNLLRLTNYVTTAEAQKEYQAQNTKADTKFLFVPYYSVNDTTVKVTDSELENYLSKHKDEFPGANTRSIQYVTFAVNPSKEDSASLYSEIKSLARGLGAAKNDSTFARQNSDVPVRLYQTIGEMPEQLRAAVPTFAPGGVYGPFRDGSTYFIYKYGGTKKDTSYTVRASHILIRATAKNDSAKALAKRRAEGILKQIQGGASFEALAQTNSDDGSSQQGGDLGYFKNNGGMVKPFETAVFGFNGTGLLPNLVETEYGYHIIKVTEPKTNVLYRVAGIGKTITPSEATTNEAYQKASQFAANSQSKEEFLENAKKDKALVVANGDRIPETASNINAMADARQVVRWAFDDKTGIGKVSEPFQVGEQYVVAVLTGKTNKDKVSIDDYRSELTAKVRNQKKAEQIIAKLGTVSGTLEAAAQKYGAGAIVETADDINIATGFLRSAGVDPVALGRVFGSKVGKRSKPFAGESGVLIVEPTRISPAPSVADYNTYKTMIQQTLAQRSSGYTNEAIKEASKITDNRAKFN